MASPSTTKPSYAYVNRAMNGMSFMNLWCNKMQYKMKELRELRIELVGSCMTIELYQQRASRLKDAIGI